VDILASIGEAVDLVGGFASAPRGLLRVSAGLGFGVHVLGLVLPQFLERYPEIEVSLRLGNRSIDLLGDGIDVAIHMGPLADSQLIASRLGSMERYLCAAPAYLERRGTPCTIEELRDHDRIETPGDSGRPRSWVFSNETGRTVSFDEKPRLSTNDTVTIHRLIVNGGGIGVLSGFICEPDFREGRLVRLLPDRISEWSGISDSAGLHRLPEEFTRYGEAVARQRAASLNVAAILLSPCVITQRADRRHHTKPYERTAGEAA
jgi:DNA-binding transcriptional LysR family regulator